jgi:protein O-mannosyl-transferase
MPSKSRQRKSEVKRPLHAQAGKSVAIPRVTHEPWKITAICIALAVVTIFAYQSVRNNNFLLYDDNYYVQENPPIQHGLTMQSIKWAFTSFDESNWHPLTWISHIIDWNFYGNNPAGHHMTNVLLHSANSILLFLLLLSITGFLGRSAIVAFLFALHPAHVESVAWLSERKDVLCAFFWFATLLAYVGYLRNSSWKRYAWVVCFYACALMSKPMAVTLPITLLLLDYWPLGRLSFAPDAHGHRLSTFLKLCVEKWPLFIMAGLSCGITLVAQKRAAAVFPLPLWEKFCNAATSYCRYVRIAFWPHPLTAHYYYDAKNINVLAAVLSAFALILVTGACWYFRKSRPYCLTGWLWFLGTLVPVIGIVQVGKQALAERYTYLPFIGIFVAAVWLAGDAITKFPKIKLPAQVLAVVVIAACAIKTDAQVKVWKDTVTLFSHAIDIDPRGELPYLNLGVAYGRQGRLTEAKEYFDRALQYNPTDSLILSDSAFCIMRIAMQTRDLRDMPLAGQRLDQALRSAPDNPNILADRALWSIMMGSPKDEEAYSRKALAANPGFVTARLYLAYALREQNKFSEAAQEYRQALALQPNNYDAHNSLGVILFQLGDYEGAAGQFRDATQLNPASAEAKRNLALAQARINTQ